jgi:hypothetical protein
LVIIKLIQTKDRLIQQFQQNVREVVEPLAANLITQGHFISNVSLTTGITNIIPTGLNQNLNGWIVTRNSANSVIWDKQDSNPTPSQTLDLLCSANCIITLYVF